MGVHGGVGMKGREGVGPKIKLGGYGMIYETIWDSSLAERWEAVVTFIALLSIADGEDNVYMNLGRLQRKTGFPEKVLRVGLEVLLEPDPESKLMDAGGRRITYLPMVDGSEATLETCRGWHVTNRGFYKRLLRKKYNTAYRRVEREAEKRGPARVNIITERVEVRDNRK